MSSKKILISFLGNINYDTRCYNLYNSLEAKGYEVNFIGFDWLTENFKSIKGNKSVFKLTKKISSVFFYLRFFLILKIQLLTRKYDILFAEDLYTLPLCIVVGKIKGAKVIYDCRELFGFLAGLKEKPFVQKLWQLVEKIFIKKADLVIVTGDMDAEFLKSEYQLKNIIVIRNLPLYNKAKSPINFYEKLNIASNKKILIYQGVVVKGRGIDMIFNLLSLTDEYVLIILGDGEHIDYYKSQSTILGISEKIHFVGKIPQDDLINYTAGAFIGLSLIENVSLSYYYALPNKLFEYVMAEIPVITTDLPQMKKIIDDYNVGFTVKENDIEQLLLILNNLKNDEQLYFTLKSNCVSASKILNWDNEFKNLENFISIQILQQ
jgi:glycosyltransferase involved in cell wall biosynthesis